MKLYYSPGACSLAPHIVLCELGVPYEKERVDLTAKKTETGADFLKINTKGSVPALKMESGEVLTEGAVIMHYMADIKSECGLLPKSGTTEYYRQLEWLNFIATEVHKTMGSMFGAKRWMKTDTAREELTSAMLMLMGQKLTHITEKLGKNDFLMGQTFTAADAYLFTVLGWAKYVNLDLAPYPAIEAYLGRVAARPAVQRAMKEEGLIK